MFDQDSLTAAKLAAEIVSIVADPARRRTMSEAMRQLAIPDAAERIVDECYSLA